MTFEEAIDIVLSHEGGYVNDPNDPGGETNFGISKRAYPDVDISALQRQDAVAIYRRDYWDATSINELPDVVRGTVFDMAVNAGRSRAIKLLQETTNAFTVSQISADGEVGPITLGAVQVVPAGRLLKGYTVARSEYYMDLARGNAKLKKFLGGWLNRAFAWLG